VVADPCECDSEPLEITKGELLLDRLGTYKLMKVEPVR